MNFYEVFNDVKSRYKPFNFVYICLKQFTVEELISNSDKNVSFDTHIKRAHRIALALFTIAQAIVETIAR